jgi:glycerate kinase
LARVLLDLPRELDHRSDSHLALIEMASASGLALLRPEARDPWQTSSVGTGQLLRAARDWGAGVILLGIGGTATNDLGVGTLAELGIQFVDSSGWTVQSLAPAEWSRVSQIRGQVERMPPIRIACDVVNPLLGPSGATAVYGPQKGLKSGDVDRMENEMRRMASLIHEFSRRSMDLVTMPGAGAAGGIAYTLRTCLDAKLVEGFELTLRWCDIKRRLQDASLVLTGEGRFDETSLQGKGAGALALRARALGKTVHVFAGQTGGTPPEGITLHAISPQGVPLQQALSETPANLAAAIARVF